MSPLSLIPLPYRLLALAALAAALFGYGWLKGAQHGEAKLDKQTITLQAQALKSQTDAAAKTRAWQAKKDEALREANKRQIALRRDAAVVRRSNDSLRDDLTAARADLSRASGDALRKHTATLNAVFGECAAEVERLAGAAAGHAADTLTFEQAWPENPKGEAP